MKMAIKGWVKESHKSMGRSFSSEVAFWRNEKSQGFVEINEIEEDAPARPQGKYQVQINTPHNLDTKVFKTKSKAIAFGKRFMRSHPNG